MLPRNPPLAIHPPNQQAPCMREEQLCGSCHRLLTTDLLPLLLALEESPLYPPPPATIATLMLPSFHLARPAAGFAIRNASKHGRSSCTAIRAATAMEMTKASGAEGAASTAKKAEHLHHFLATGLASGSGVYC